MPDFRPPSQATKMLGGLLLAALAAGLLRTFSLQSAAPLFAQAGVESPPDSVPYFASGLVSSRKNAQVHAASAVELRDGRIRAFWYSGSREGAKDVQIRSAIFEPERGVWGEEQVITDRVATQRDLFRYIKKLGNPVVVRAADGALLLFYVSVSLGGWSGSSITMLASADDGATWGKARRLITSPFLNVSTLVKGTPFRYADGSLGLPVYHELSVKFGEILRLSPTGEVLSKQRLSAGGEDGLQPEPIIADARRAVMLMRNGGEKSQSLLRVSTENAGKNWSPPTQMKFANSDSAVAATALLDGGWLLVLNDQTRGRTELSMHLSYDRGATWKRIYQLEDRRTLTGDALRAENFLALVTASLVESGTASAAVARDYRASFRKYACYGEFCEFKFAYPHLLQARNGTLHLFYTYNQAVIKHIAFNPSWLRARWREREH